MITSARLYDLRWWLSALLLLFIGTLFVSGFGRVQRFSAQVDTLQDEPPTEGSDFKVFDARYDIWFDPEDPGLQLYQQIEDQFVAEDFVLVAFAENEHPLGVFAPRSLETIASLTEKIERVPFVRHVRSLTSNPWIRWGDVGENPVTGERDEGLLVTDLFEQKPDSYDEDQVVERAVAVLGAQRASDLLGESRVRQIVGADAEFADLIGEPRLIGNVISDDGRTTAFQVQILRPRLTDDDLTTAFGEDEDAHIVGNSMHANESQWEALGAIEQVLEKTAAAITSTSRACH